MTTSPVSGSDPSRAFDRLHPGVQRWIWEQGWRDLRDAQEAAVAPLSAGDSDVLISAATASGKTEAAFLPICSVLASAGPSPGISALYVGNTTSFPDGSSAVLTDQPESAGARDTFYQKATGRSAAQAKATWARLTFTGKGTRPKELKSDADVKAFVASNPKAIGYIDASAVDSSVKVVLKL